MLKHFLEEGMQAKINYICLAIVGDGEELERSLECLHKTEK